MSSDDDDIENEKEFDELILAFMHIGNKLEGTKNVLGTKNLIYAEGLGQKILHHTLSIKHLSSGYTLSAKGNIYEPRIDFASICILTRAVLETYLTFNHIYIQPKDILEHEFRFYCWDYAGFVERLKFSTRTSESIQQHKEETASSLIVKNEIESNPNFMKLKSKEQKEILKGNWRLNNSWSDLAVASGFSKSFFDEQYRFLCGYAHSSRLSIIQIQQVKDRLNQKKMALASIGTIMVVLAKHMYNYINLIPELKVLVDVKSSEYYLIDLWKQVGEKL